MKINLQIVLSNVAVGGKSCWIAPTYFSLVAENVIWQKPVACAEPAVLLFNASPCWTCHAHPASNSKGPGEALCQSIANISTGTHKFYFPLICGCQMMDQHFSQSTQWLWHCCWMPIFQIFARHNSVNDFHFIYCHAEIFSSVAFLSKFHLFSWNFSLLLFILLLAFMSCSSWISPLCLSSKPNKKGRFIYWNYSHLQNRRTFFPCSLWL